MIELAFDVTIAVLLDTIVPALGFTIDSAEKVIAEADLNKNSVIIKSNLFFYTLVYFFFLKFNTIFKRF